MKRTLQLLGLLLVAALSTGPHSVAASNSGDYDYCFVEEIDDKCFFAVCVDGDDIDWVLFSGSRGVGVGRKAAVGRERCPRQGR